jgi:phosphoribosylglycinamide formyltransferase-1
MVALTDGKNRSPRPPMSNVPTSFISPALLPPDLNLDNTISLGVLASGSGSNFAALAEAIAAQKLNAQIKLLIYNNPQALVQERARKWGIPSLLLNHRDYGQREALDRAIVTNFQEQGVEWVIMAGWMRVVTEVLLSAFPERVINIHPSLLPSFKGIRAIEQALAAGVKITGCTVHLAHLDVDSGPILMQAAVPILPEDNADTLHQRIQKMEHLILPQAIALAAKQATV